MSVASDERGALIELMDEVGAEAPTLCEGWLVRDLAAHLVVRERRPDAAPGILIPPLASLTERAMREYTDRPWPQLLDLLREGPPRWSPLSVDAIADRVNLVEFFVHHEDVRRGSPGWEPRPPDARRDEALWRTLGMVGRVLFRRSPVGVMLRRPDGEQRLARTGPRPVVVAGAPGELVLYAYGRAAVRVDLQGERAAVQAFQRSPRGL